MRIKFAMQVWAANEIKKWKRQKKILKKENKGIFPQPPKSSYFSKSKIFLITKQGEKYGKILFVLLLLLRSASRKILQVRRVKSDAMLLARIFSADDSAR